MNFNNIKEKALWRMPNTTEILSIDSQNKGDDRFLIAPFLKDEKVFFVRGKHTVLEKAETESFIENTKLKYDISVTSSENDYTNLVNKAITEINEGKFEKVVLARQVFIEKEVDVAALFLALEKKYPNALVFWFVLNNGLSMIGATPETLMSKTNDTLVIEALGGTKQTYGYSEKEELEHTQIVKYIKNILIDHSTQFTIGEQFSKNAGNLEHLCTPFTVTSRGASLDNDLLKQLHPTSAICGLPFAVSLKFIADNEPFKRGYYAGYIGPKLANDDFHFFVNLRSGNLFTNGILLTAGAGINSASEAKDEWLETENKIDTIGQCM
ncbi:MAG: chorismate-binding protein [Bacteroidetes bacterium]|nr:chorismate-binding protein [Bacteroidota bacterium]